MNAQESLEAVVHQFQQKLDGGDATDRSAAARLIGRLSRSNEVKVASEQDGDGLDDLSLEELLVLGQEHLEPDAAAPAEPVVGDDSEKLAAEKTAARAQIATHAFFQELQLIKEANRLGICRFCKEQPAVAGATLCTECGS